jgi:hypothetical protein
VPVQRVEAGAVETKDGKMQASTAVATAVREATESATTSAGSAAETTPANVAATAVIAARVAATTSATATRTQQLQQQQKEEQEHSNMKRAAGGDSVRLVASILPACQELKTQRAPAHVHARGRYSSTAGDSPIERRRRQI